MATFARVEDRRDGRRKEVATAICDPCCTESQICDPCCRHAGFNVNTCLQWVLGLLALLFFVLFVVYAARTGECASCEAVPAMTTSTFAPLCSSVPSGTTFKIDENLASYEFRPPYDNYINWMELISCLVPPEPPQIKLEVGHGEVTKATITFVDKPNDPLVVFLDCAPFERRSLCMSTPSKYFTTGPTGLYAGPTVQCFRPTARQPTPQEKYRDDCSEQANFKCYQGCGCPNVGGSRSDGVCLQYSTWY